MATAKKKPTKKPSAKAAVRKTTPRKSPVRQAAATTRHNRQFMEARFTEQTLYWLIIGAAVIGLAVWVISLQVRLNNIYDSIDKSSTQTYVPANKPQL